MLSAHTESMSLVRHVFVVVHTIVFISRALAESICYDDFYGVLEGKPFTFPEHFLLPRVVDWAIPVPSVCVGEYVSGMKARVCTFVPTTTIRIINTGTAIVHMTKEPSYTSVNITVYCSAHLKELPPPPDPLTTTLEPETSSTEIPKQVTATSILELTSENATVAESLRSRKRVTFVHADKPIKRSRIRITSYSNKKPTGSVLVDNSF